MVSSLSSFSSLPSLGQLNHQSCRILRTLHRQLLPKKSHAQPLRLISQNTRSEAFSPRPSAVFFFLIYHVSARDGKVAADIVNVAVKKLVELFMEGANVLDLCVEGDKLIEEGTSAVYNKSVKGVKVSKGSSCSILCHSCKNQTLLYVAV